MKLSKKAIISLLLAGIFLSSVLVVFSGKHIKKEYATIIVDMGNNKVYKGEIPVVENTSALKALSQFAYSVDIQNGSIYCIADYCNNNISEWKFYKAERIDGRYNEEEINQSVENYLISNGETLIFKYEVI